MGELACFTVGCSVEPCEAMKVKAQLKQPVRLEMSWMNILRKYLGLAGFWNRYKLDCMSASPLQGPSSSGKPLGEGRTQAV